MPLAAGARLGAYQIVSLIGAGGMGEVYRARDTRLNREVAIKILPEAFAADPDRIARFTREAQILASLNHPHIAQIYGVEESGITRALVMELVEGETLADRIARGAIPIDEALPVARQIADALEAAHDAGIIHRDLKPANIKLRPDGTVKVLDFGLAKEIATDDRVASAPTITTPAMTHAGMILGTAAYMSPEQAKGKTVDRRADIWAFGCVLYEMLTGRRAFSGGDVTDVIAAIMRDQPDWAALPADTPGPVRTLLERCLHKNPRERLPHVGLARFELTSTRASTPAPARRRYAAVVGVSLLLMAMAGAAVAVSALLNRRASVTAKAIRFDIPVDNMPNAFALTISPDGRHIAYAATDSRGKSLVPMLHLRALAQVDDRIVPGTEGVAGVTWSADSRSIFFATGSALMRVVVNEGGPQRVATIAGGVRVCSASRQGRLICSDGSGRILEVPSAGGTASPVLPIETVDGEPLRQQHPSFLPDGDHFLYLSQKQGTIEGREVRVGSIESRSSRTLFASESFAQYSAPGFLLFVRGVTLFAQPFDADRLALTGDAVPVVEGVAINRANGRAAFDVSADGTLIYRSGIDDSRWSVNWLNGQGQKTGAAATGGQFIAPALSPDGTRIAFHRLDSLGGDVWIAEAETGRLTRLTFDTTQANASPIWSPDGTRVVFRSRRNNRWGLYAKSANGLGAEQLLFESALIKSPMSWSPDGKFVLFMMTDPETSWDIWAVETATGKAFPMLNSRSNEGHPQVSPDGHWLAYGSNESGASEVNVKPFPGGSGKWQVSNGGGYFARWRGDGRQLIFWDEGSMNGTSNPATLVAVDVKATGGALEFSTPRPLFSSSYIGGPVPGYTGNYFPWTMSADGTRFLLAQADGDPRTTVSTPLTVLVNWSSTLKY